jgi:tetratricopeptide (TPR) repeat protein
LDLYLSAPDSVYYFGVPRSLVMNGDLAFEDEIQDFHFPPNQFYLTERGHVANDWPIGSGLVWTPLYALGRAVAAATHPRAGQIPGAGPWEKAITALGIVALGLGAIALTWRLAREVAGEGAATWATLSTAIGGPLVFYILCFPLMSHVTSFAAVALFLWGWHTTRGERTTAQWLLLGLLFGWLGVIRPQNVACGVVWIVEWFGERRGRDAAHRLAWFRGLALAAPTALLAFVPQMLLWARLYGNPLQLPKFEEMHWLTPHVWELLFSDFHGLLIWTPAWALPVLGIVPLIRRDRVLGWAIGLTLALQLYLNAANEIWWAGGSFSNRRFADHTAFAAVAAAPLFAMRRVRWVAILWTALSVAWALTLIWAERARLISLDHYVSLPEMGRAAREVLIHPVTHAPSLVGDFGGLGPVGRIILLSVACVLSLVGWRLRSRISPGHFTMRGAATLALAAQLTVVALVGAALLRTQPTPSELWTPAPPRHNAVLWNNFYEYGFHRVSRGDLEGGKRAFQRAVDLWPDYPQPHRYLGQIARDQGDLPAAIAHLERALRIDPHYEPARDLLNDCRRRLDESMP